MDNDKYQKHLLEIYKIYLKTAEDTSDRRLRSNNFYFSICSLILTSIGGIVIYVLKNKGSFTKKLTFQCIFELLSNSNNTPTWEQLATLSIMEFYRFV